MEPSGIMSILTVLLILIALGDTSYRVTCQHIVDNYYTLHRRLITYNRFNMSFSLYFIYTK